MITLTSAFARRLSALVLVALFASVGPAFAQGAGDDQYRDPFPDEAQTAQADDTPTSTSSEGLSDTPPPADTGSDADSDTSTGTGTTADTDTESGDTADEADEELAQTGDEPLLIALAGGSLLLLGAGMRMRIGARRRD